MMRRVLTWSVLVILSGYGLFAFPAPVEACVCIKHSDPADAYENAEMVFKGEIIAVGDLEGTDNVLYGFKVDAVWKGPRYETLYVSTQQISYSSCGTGFEKDKTYIVYAYGVGDEPGHYGVSLCSRILSRPSEIWADSLVIGDPEAPIAGANAERPKRYADASQGLSASFRRPAPDRRQRREAADATARLAGRQRTHVLS